MTDQPTQLAERFYAALDAGEVPGMLELCADDVSIRYPAEGRLPYGGQWDGRDGAGRFLEAHDEAEEILEFEVREMIGQGETVVAIGQFKGRAKPSGGEWSTDFVHVLTFSDGLLETWQAFYDTAAAINAHAPRQPRD